MVLGPGFEIRYETPGYEKVKVRAVWKWICYCVSGQIIHSHFYVEKSMSE